MRAFWMIEIQSHSGDWRPYRPSVDGKERLFKKRRDAEDYAYDYGIAGGRNQFVRFVKFVRKP